MPLFFVLDMWADKLVFEGAPRSFAPLVKGEADHDSGGGIPAQSWTLYKSMKHK